MIILGISCFQEHSSAALLVNGAVVASIAERRISRVLNDTGFPVQSVKFCLEVAKLQIADVDYVACSMKPFLSIERDVYDFMCSWPWDFRKFNGKLIKWVTEHFFLRKKIKRLLNFAGKILFLDNHQAKAAATFFTSGFEESAILVVDDSSGWAMQSIGRGVKNKIILEREIHYPHSVNLLFKLTANFLGFNGEKKSLLTLVSRSGKPRYKDVVYNKLIYRSNDGSFQLRSEVIGVLHSDKKMNVYLERVFQCKYCSNADDMEQIHFDFASSVLQVIEESLGRMIYHSQQNNLADSWCLGGNFFNHFKVDSEMLTKTSIKKIYTSFLSEDEEAAVGASLFTYYHILEAPCLKSTPVLAVRKINYFEDAHEFLDRLDVPYQRLREEDLLLFIVNKVTTSQIVAWYSGSLGADHTGLNRSSILFNHLRCDEGLFDHCEHEIPNVKELRSSNGGSTSLLHKLFILIGEKQDIVGIRTVPFNSHNEPLVLTPQDAWRIFLKTKIDYLIMGNCVIERSSIHYVKY